MAQVTQWHRQMTTAGVRESRKPAATRTGGPTVGQVPRNRPLEYVGVGGALLWLAVWIGFMILALAGNPGATTALIS